MEIRNYINGKFIDSISKKSIPVLNPADQNLVEHIDEALDDEIDLAFLSAKEAFEIEDKLSGITDENNIDVFLDGKKIIVEYNSYRNTVHYKLKNNLKIGTHSLKIEVRDNVGNANTIDGDFFIQ